MYDVVEIDELIQGSSGIMPAMKKGKLRVTVRQVNGQEQVHTLWPVQFCPSAGANLFLLTCKLLRGHKISSDDANNIVVITPISNIILDRWNKTRDGWVAGVDFIRNAVNEKAVTATALIKQDINDLHVELGHPSEAITRSTAKSFGIQVTDTFRPCEDRTLGKAKQQVVSKKAVPCSQILGERLFFDISSTSTPTFGAKRHQLLVFDDYSDFSWSFFLNEKSDLTQKMVGLIKDLKTKYNWQVQRLQCDNLGGNQAFERACNQEGLGINFEYTAPGTPQQNGRQTQVCYPIQSSLRYA